MKQSVADGDTAGMTIILIRHGQVADFKSFGQQTPDKPMALDSLFRIYSMSKPITGVAMMQLYEQGKWQLDDPITKHAPELANLKALTWDKDGKVVMGADGKPVLTTPKKPATMRQLMSHTAGFGYGLAGDDPVNRAFRDEGVLASKNLDEMMKKIADIPLLYEPGTKWSYSVAVDIQGYLVQKLSGQKFGDYLKDHVTGPMGMTDTAFYVTPDRKAALHRGLSLGSRAERARDEPAAHRSRRLRGSHPARIRRRRPGRLDARLRAVLPDAAQQGRDRRQAHSQARDGQADDREPHRRPARVAVDGTRPQPGAEAVRFGLDFAVYIDPKSASLPYGKGTFYWGGAAGTWFWIDPVNDLAFIGMIQIRAATVPAASTSAPIRPSWSTPRWRRRGRQRRRGRGGLWFSV